MTFPRGLWAVVLVACSCGHRAAAQQPVPSPVPTITSAMVATASMSAEASVSPTPTATATPGPTVTLSAARVIARGPADRRAIALTFDAGADAGYAAQILDILRANGVHASFGMTGQWAEQHPDLVRRMVDEGHQIINHTYDHASFTGVSTVRPPLSREARARELQQTEDIVRAIAGVEMRPYFRPPFGDYDASVNADAAAAGYTDNVMWTVDSLGWRGASADQIVARCLQGASPGAILIFHVGSQSQDAIALPSIIQGLRQQGYDLGTVRQLLEG